MSTKVNCLTHGGKFGLSGAIIVLLKKQKSHSSEPIYTIFRGGGQQVIKEKVRGNKVSYVRKYSLTWNKIPITFGNTVYYYVQE